VFGSDYGPIPYGIKEHVQIVEDVLPSPADRQQVFWKTSNKVFRLGLSDQGALDEPAANQVKAAAGEGLPSCLKQPISELSAV
jgi:hypothetical protein